ncbi:MAG: universal stress protein [Candidatus Abyssobacteria bacterium SURF_17]|uniref:Universal stress protein n=1 Tax=Candidatus Abyssobacteria bacterium SURF_17 TaxID=2093361 RepID=A0A419ERC3_9BACT|nr:MAG: universal stress protein [Candidatus Abyssubacteria bacterium SURF_17]
MLPLKKILCPTDFSEASYEGLKAANELALHFSAELSIVHVIPPIPTPVGLSPVGPAAPASFNVPSYQKELEESSTRTLREVVEQRVSKNLSVKRTIVHGSAAQEIVRVADEEGIDLIVIASHGQTGWRRIMYGSVAEKVVRLAQRPVLAVPAPHDEE